MAAIEIKNLSKTFHDRSTGKAFTAVEDVSFTIEEGSFVTLLGPSGCGKTTILRMITGFEVPSSGAIYVYGKDFTRTPPEHRNLPLVFQNYALFPHLTVFENVAYPLRVKKWQKKEIGARVGETLAMMNLDGLASRRPEEMSGGQQQRVALARALVSKPKIILFDEPLSNLDAKLRAAMRVELKKLQRQAGVTAIYVTHDQEEAMALSDTVILLNHGKVEQIDSPEGIYFCPANHFVADFIGRANFASVMLESGVPGTYCARLWGEVVRELHGRAGLPPGEYTLMIRPEAIRFRPDGDFNATLEHLMFLGSVSHCEINVGGAKLLAERPSELADEELRPGTSLRFSIDTRRVFLLPTDSSQTSSAPPISLETPPPRSYQSAQA